MSVSIIGIKTVESNPPGLDFRLKLNEEWIELENTNLSQDYFLDGWEIWHKTEPKDRIRKAYTFKRFTLYSGKRVKIHSGHGMDTLNDLFMNQGNFVWNNTGDEAYLYDFSMKLIDKKTVPATDN